jgi:phthalate 4,5-cis-dihydrodiol dehydrogenase
VSQENPGSPRVTERKLRIGAAGLGRAFALMVPALSGHPKIELVAAADPRDDASASFAAEHGLKAYCSVEDLCADPEVDALYVATPHQFHAQHVIAAARHGKHVLVEKPMALSLEECRAMIEATRKAGVQLVVGHSHSYDAPIARTREIIAAGTVGRLRMISGLYFTDFLYRPRRPEELAASSGGGVVVNQAPHHVDIVRLLGGGLVKSVRALTAAWDHERPVDGAYAALLTFENGAFATLTYSGYAHFDGDELGGWIAESGYPKNPDVYGAARSVLQDARTPVEELALKHARNYGGPDFQRFPEGPRLHQHFGLLIVSCERADLRPGPAGVTIYGDHERSFEPVRVPQIPRSEVIDEFHAAIIAGKPPLHSGEWGLATMEVCFAMMQSAREGREIPLNHQVPANG